MIWKPNKSSSVLDKNVQSAYETTIDNLSEVRFWAIDVPGQIYVPPDQLQRRHVYLKEIGQSLFEALSPSGSLIANLFD